MTVRRHLLPFAVLLAPLNVRAQASGAVKVEVGGNTRTVTFAEMTKLPQDTLRVRAHDGPEQTFVGPRLSAILTLAGARLDSLRGRALAQYVLIEARDGYRVAYAIAELSSSFTTRRVILAPTADGHALGESDGPLRVVAEGDLRPARWVRQVTVVRLRTASE
jgi:DMSO/TMAO reductase YedYZ molybdopterin-dependent catalytic subunit